MNIFGERLKELREARGLSQVKFADFLGVTKGAVSMWECGKRVPSAATLDSIARRCNIAVSWLIDDGVDDEYYCDSKTQKFAQEIYNRPEMRVLFDCAKNADKEDVLFVARMLERLEGSNAKEER